MDNIGVDRAEAPQLFRQHGCATELAPRSCGELVSVLPTEIM